MKINIRSLIIATISWTTCVIVSCEKLTIIKDSPSDPVSVFDELWSEMDRRYALFSIKNVDWNEIYSRYRPKVTENVSENTLFQILDDMLQELKDGHVALISSYDTAVYNNFYTLYPINFNYENIKNNYLKMDFKTSGPFEYKTVDSIGYVYYSSFKEDFSDSELASMIQDLAQTKGLILDVRSNPGGRSSNVDRLASCFIKENKLVKYEVRKNGPGHSDLEDPLPYYIKPGIEYYNKPVIVLANRSCFSGCNDFVLYLSELPGVRIYGDQTGGGGAIPQNYILANGWKIQYSSSITLTPSLEAIENGIIPDRYITITGIQEANGIDPIIDQAYLTLK